VENGILVGLIFGWWDFFLEDILNLQRYSIYHVLSFDSVSKAGTQIQSH
jgi:hypothetical protein